MPVCLTLVILTLYLSPTLSKLWWNKIFIMVPHLRVSASFGFVLVQIQLTKNMRLDSPALSPLSYMQKITLLFSKGPDHIDSFSLPWRVTYNVIFFLCECDFHVRRYWFREELASRYRSRVSCRVFLSSRVRSGAEEEQVGETRTDKNNPQCLAEEKWCYWKGRKGRRNEKIKFSGLEVFQHLSLQNYSIIYLLAKYWVYL